MLNAVVSFMEIREPKNKQELERCFDLRYRVLLKPWNQPIARPYDAHSGKKLNIAAFDDGEIVGAGQLQKLSDETARIRYMAVEEGWRTRGAGRLMLQRLEDEARKWGMKGVTLNAREEAVAFYEHNGYRVLREVEKLFGSIRHFRMEKLARGFNNAKQF